MKAVVDTNGGRLRSCISHGGGMREGPDSSNRARGTLLHTEGEQHAGWGISGRRTILVRCFGSAYLCQTIHKLAVLDALVCSARLT